MPLPRLHPYQSLINLWNSEFKKNNITTNKSQAAIPGTEMEIYCSFPVADPDILKI
jgi:hypothetical protein